MTTTSTTKEFTLPHPTLDKVGENEPPTAFTLRALRRQLYANATSVDTTLGGGGHGHLGIVMDASRLPRTYRT